MSSDQFYAYRICQAVISGEMDEDLGMLEIGPLRCSRWLTLGCKLLRFYVTHENPSKSLVTLAEFCIKVISHLGF